jgi:hypothetical protein
MQRGVDEHLDEGHVQCLVDSARGVAVARVGADEADDRNPPGVGQQRRDVGGAPDVLGAADAIEAKVAVEAVTQVVAVEPVGVAPGGHGTAFDLGRERDFPDAGSPVSHSVAPDCPRLSQRWARVSVDGLQTTLVLGSANPQTTTCAPVGCSTIAAPDVSGVAPSMRMKLPVDRLRRYASTASGAARRRRTLPMSFSLGSVADSSRCSLLTSMR